MPTRDQQLIVFSLVKSLHEILSMSESTVLKFNNSDSFILNKHWFISTGCNEYEYNIDIKLIIFEICFIHTPTHSDS